MTLFKMIQILLLGFLFQAQTCVENDLGPAVKETRDIGTFTAIDVSDGIDVYLSQGEAKPLIVEAQEQLIEDLITEVEDDVLKIYLDRNFTFVKTARINITAPVIKKVKTSGGSDLMAETVIAGKELVLEASGGSDIKIEVEVENIGIRTSGGSDVDISGTADKLVAKTSGGSDLNGFGLIVHKAKLESSGGSDIEIHVLDELWAIASGGSDIIYKGNPSDLEIESSSSSDVIQRD